MLTYAGFLIISALTCTFILVVWLLLLRVGAQWVHTILDHGLERQSAHILSATESVAKMLAESMTEVVKGIMVGMVGVPGGEGVEQGKVPPEEDINNPAW